MKSLSRWQRLVAAILLIQALYACGGSSSADTSTRQPDAASAATAPSKQATAAGKNDADLHFAP